MFVKYILPLLFLTHFCLAQTPEICTNGLDDDQDGWIDLNDSDCSCQKALPISPIPNPSFETKDCCPLSPAGFPCLSDWVQPSEATTDYSHACDWMQWEEYPIPLPIPDGNGCVGFRDGDFLAGNVYPNWKEYAASCLDFPLTQHLEYTLEVSVGFSTRDHSPPLSLAVFGTQDCEDILFGEGDFGFGCPKNDKDWELLGKTDVSGTNEWKRVRLILRPKKETHAIAIGPSCQAYTGTGGTYYFLDHIELVDQSDFEPGIFVIDHPCSSTAIPEVNSREGYTYQWYKDGIALQGEKANRLSQWYGTGPYQVRFEAPDGSCELTEPYSLERPESYQELESVICEGETFLLGKQEITTSGVYLDTLWTKDGCDSIVLLDLQVKADLGDTIEAKIFPSEFYQIGTNRFTSPGEYEIALPSSAGCDSTVFLHLSYYDIFAPTAFSPNGDGVNEYFSLMGGQEVIVISRLKIFNRWGKLIYEQQGLSPGDVSAGWNGNSKGTPAAEGVYMFLASVLFDDGKERTTSGSFTLLR